MTITEIDDNRKLAQLILDKAVYQHEKKDTFNRMVKNYSHHERQAEKYLKIKPEQRSQNELDVIDFVANGPYEDMSYNYDDDEDLPF